MGKEFGQRIQEASDLFKQLYQGDGLKESVQDSSNCVVVAARALTGFDGYNIDFIEQRKHDPWDVYHILLESGVIFARYGRRFGGIGAKDFGARVLREPELLVDERERHYLESHIIAGLWCSVLYSTDMSKDHAILLFTNDNLPSHLQQSYRESDSIIAVDTLNPSLISKVHILEMAQFICSGPPQKALAPMFQVRETPATSNVL